MTNEGELYPELDERERRQRIQDFNARCKRGSITPRSGRGVTIGMTEPQVRRILGAPARTLHSKRFSARELIYRRVQAWPKSKQPDNGTGMSWTNYYLFRNGRLFYIELAQDLEGGA